tara:strand:+ start:2633 stop:3043 length:411 start_codon:yes stop_codon:yes gene_type:complete
MYFNKRFVELKKLYNTGHAFYMLYPQEIKNHLQVDNLMKALGINELQYFFVYFKKETDRCLYVPFNKELISNVKRTILIPELVPDMILKKEDVLFNTQENEYNEGMINDLGAHGHDLFKEIESRSPKFTHSGIGLY